MPRDAANRLVEFLQTRADDYLRGAVHYSADDYETLYMRADVDDLYSPENMEELFRYFRHKNRDQNRKEPFDLGNDHCTVDFYDDAILFHFTQGEEVGTVITLDPEAGRDIVQFITECIELLHRDSPQEISNAPEWIRE